MWHASYSEREFIDFWRDPVSRKLRKPRPRSVSSVSETLNERGINAYWQNEPHSELFFPNILVASETTFDALFARLNTIPLGYAPLSANSRILLLSELDACISSTPLALTEKPLAGSVALAIAEATLRADPAALRQVSAASCKRTFAYALNLALIRGADPTSFEELRTRWHDVYRVINPDAAEVDFYNGFMTEAMAMVIQMALLNDQCLSTPEGDLATFLHKHQFADIGKWWDQFAGPQSVDVSFERLISSSQTELDSYLHQALGRMKYGSDLPIAAMCALIATVAAPGSLDYLDRFRNSNDPGIAFLYALYAALRWPEQILSERGGLGYQLLRDLVRNEDPWAYPTADIAYLEFKALDKPDLDAFLKRLDPTGDVIVELMPALTVSFEQLPREESPPEHLLAKQGTPMGIGPEHLGKLEQAIDLLTQLVNDNVESGAKGRLRQR